MTRCEQIGEATLYLADCADILPTYEKSIDAVVTSPPYDAIRDYGTQGARPLECIPLIAALPRPGGVIVWNVADQTIDGSETGSSFEQALAFKAEGLRIHDTMIYCKEGVTFPDSNRYHPSFEFMFVFSNGAPSHFNGIKDWRNKWVGNSKVSTDRYPDGTTRVRQGRPVQSEGLRRNWWIIANPYTGETAGHPAPMPYTLAADHIFTWTDMQETVFDPFMGSGTAGVAALRLGRKFVGVEIEPRYFEIALRRVEEASRQLDLFTVSQM
jgi:site-specific DNA-methyltransferase (adenine-specific)